MSIALRVVIDARYQENPSDEFLRHLKWHLWNSLFGGLLCPVRFGNEVCQTWFYDLVWQPPTHGNTRALITINARFGTNATEALIAALKEELPKKMMSTLTAPGHSAPTGWNVDVHEPEPVRKAG